MPNVCPCHGEPWVMDGSERRCIVKKRIKDKRASKKYRGTAKSKARDLRYKQTHYRLRVDRITLGTYPVNPQQREAIQAFRSKQREETNGRFDPPVA